MNNMLPSSECCSGCESGWTLYLEHSFLSSYPSNRNNNEFVDGKGIYGKGKRSPKNEDEEEDLSMVSDASSRPQIFHEDEYYGNGSNGCLNNAPIDAALPKKRGKGKKNRENPSPKVQEHPSFLDDTAVFNFSQGRSEFHEPFRFFQSSLSGNHLQQNQWFAGKMG